ncbi:ATP-grasp domain-containing protein [Deinococcus roseus]|uniref:ATP-grasp domain-containing protein n=1 Tax=Deinococcus roseus TaxID=392414 RepID=A0ABQ2CWC4_9DEIO|nr:ATP-grasp domain-containing protein [Deinococcus roseus]GGJ27108.1 hypothetical protein GCM10008938_11550 [Deinococcus roseus]
MSLRFLYPAVPFDLKHVDDQYEQEQDLARSLNLSTSRISFEDLLEGVLKTSPAVPENELLLYRGWMLSEKQYAVLNQLVQHEGRRLLTSPEHYRLTHHLPEWYPALQDFTPETRFFDTPEDAIDGLQDVKWPAYFVKDWVKSLSTGHGPVAHTLEEITLIAVQMVQYRGEIEGGLCIRCFEDLLPDTEERYFVVQGQPYSRAGSIPEPVQVAAQHISTPFFSVDVVQHAEGRLRIMELGDGQVSDLKHWTLQDFQPVLQALSSLS